MTTIRKTAAVVAIAVLALGVQACEDPDAGASDDSTESTESTDEPTETESSDDSDSGEEPTGEDLQADFDLYVEWVTEYAEDKDLGTPDAWNFIEEGDSMETECVDGSGNAADATDEAFFYCGADKGVYVGEAVMQVFIDEFGVIAPGVGIAHEWGHHVQREADIPINSQEEYINFENQADCIGGAWYGDLSTGDRGVKPMEFLEIAELMMAISELEGPDRTHGTLVERTSSVTRGGLQGLKECDSYFPDDSILD